MTGGAARAQQRAAQQSHAGSGGAAGDNTGAAQGSQDTGEQLVQAICLDKLIDISVCMFKYLHIYTIL